MRLIRMALAMMCLCGVFAAPSVAQYQQRSIVVNGQELGQQEIDTLVSLYGQVYVGRYWYDPVSGLYGYEGQGPFGQMMPNLSIGGPLQANASGGGSGYMTGVFINGREISQQEYMFLYSIFGQVIPGRYWINAQGIGGIEGQPTPMFNIVAAAQQAAAMQGGGAYGGGQYDSHYMPWIGGGAGTSVGRASDGCIYVSQGGYSNDFC